MKKIRHTFLESVRSERPVGYVTDLTQAATSVDEDFIYITIQNWNAVQKKHFPENPRLIPEEPRGLGDVVETVFKPIARALGADCIDPESQTLKPESGCAKRRDNLNKAVPFKK